MALTFLPFRFPGIPGVSCLFSARAAGNLSLEAPEAADNPAPTLARREALIRSLALEGMEVQSLAEVRQVHGTHTVFEPDPQPSQSAPAREADGMAASRRGLGLAVKTADCQPVLLAHQSGRYIAALHVGWKGNRHNYPGLAVAEFCGRYGIRPAEVSAVRGPSLGPDAARFTNFDAEWGDDFRPWFNADAQTMDLWRLTRDQLIRAGLRADHIYGVDLCTLSLPESFFSFRHDRRCGRQMSFISIA